MTQRVEPRVLESHSLGVGLGFNQRTGDMCLTKFQNFYGPVTAMCLLFLFSFPRILNESVYCSYPESVSLLYICMLGVWEQIICLFIQIKRNYTPVAVPEELHLRSLNHTWT